MPSTTDNTATSHAVVPPTLPTSLVNQGMAVLKDMIGHIRLPADVQAERAALAALCLLSRSDLSSALDPINIELRGDLARLRRSEVAALRQWIYPWRLTSRPPWWMFRRRRLRHFHLFVLLGRVAAPLYQFEMIQELDALGACPEKEDCHYLLAWLPRFFARKRTRRLAQTYIDLTVASWYGDTPRPDSRFSVAIADEFVRWPALRQVLELLSWRRKWDQLAEITFSSDPRPSPTEDVTTIEFNLARRRQFRRIAWRGGAVAAGILKELGYRDAQIERPHRVGSPLILLGLLMLAIAVVIGWWARAGARNWHQRNLAALESMQIQYEHRLNNLEELLFISPNETAAKTEPVADMSREEPQ